MITEIKETTKDYFKLTINGVEFCEIEKSELRKHIEKIDNKIL